MRWVYRNINLRALKMFVQNFLIVFNLHNGAMIEVGGPWDL